MIVPCERGGCLTVSVQARPVGTAAPLTLVVNGVSAGRQGVGLEWNRYEWSVPADALRQGMNSFVLRP